jgi:hypothetical protein
MVLRLLLSLAYIHVHEFVRGPAASLTWRVVRPLSVSCKCGRVVVFGMHTAVCERQRIAVR